MWSFVAQSVKNLPAVQGTWIRFLGREDPPEKEMAAHSSILAWRTPRAEAPGGLQSMGHRVRDGWARTQSIAKKAGEAEWLNYFWERHVPSCFWVSLARSVGKEPHAWGWPEEEKSVRRGISGTQPQTSLSVTGSAGDTCCFWLASVWADMLLWWAWAGYVCVDTLLWWACVGAVLTCFYDGLALCVCWHAFMMGLVCVCTDTLLWWAWCECVWICFCDGFGVCVCVDMLLW